MPQPHYCVSSHTVVVVSRFVVVVVVVCVGEEIVELYIFDTTSLFFFFMPANDDGQFNTPFDHQAQTSLLSGTHFPSIRETLG